MDHKAKAAITVQCADGSVLAFEVSAARISSFTEIGDKLGAAIQSQIDQVAADHAKHLNVTIDELRKRVAELEKLAAAAAAGAILGRK